MASLGEAVTALRERVVATLQDVRRLAVELRPAALDDFGLEAALERLTTGFAEQTGMKVELESRLHDDRLPEEVETVLYRTVQEALTNIIKHAAASRVEVALLMDQDAVRVTVRDDGRGFDPAEPVEGFGLVGIRERVMLASGQVTIEAQVGKGTAITARVPVRPATELPALGTG